MFRNIMTVKKQVLLAERNETSLTTIYLDYSLEPTAMTVKKIAAMLIDNTYVTKIDIIVTPKENKESSPFVPLIDKILKRNKLYALQREYAEGGLKLFAKNYWSNSIEKNKEIMILISWYVFHLPAMVLCWSVGLIMRMLNNLGGNAKEVRLPILIFGKQFFFPSRDVFWFEKKKSLFRFDIIEAVFEINILSAILLPFFCFATQLLMLAETLFVIPLVVLFAIKGIFSTIVQVCEERKQQREDIKMRLLTEKALQAEIENDSLTIDFEMTLARINKQIEQTPAKENSIFEDTINKLEKLANTKLKGTDILYSLCYHYGCLLIAQGYKEQAFNYFLKIQSPHEKYTDAMYECGDYALCHLKNEKQAMEFYQKAYASSQDESTKEKLQFMINMLSHSEGDIRDVVPAPTTRKDILSPVAQSQRYKFFKKGAEANKMKTDPIIIKNNHAVDRNLQLNAG